MSKEICSKCDQKTGNAGKGEDSLFTPKSGPLCLECFREERRLSLSKIEISKGLAVALLETPKYLRDHYSQNFSYIDSLIKGKTTCTHCKGEGCFETEKEIFTCPSCLSNGSFSVEMVGGEYYQEQVRKMINEEYEIGTIAFNFLNDLY